MLLSRVRSVATTRRCQGHRPVLRSGGKIRSRRIPAPAFNPCCCDCNGKYDILRCCRGMSMVSIVMYTVILVTSVAIIVNTKHLTAKEYDGDVDDAPEFVQDYEITFDGFRNSTKGFLVMSCLMLCGYGMLYSVTIIENGWSPFLPLGLPVSTGLSALVQLTFYLHYDGHKTGILINFYLLLDIYFSICALSLFTSLRPNNSAVTDSSIFDFPEYPGEDGQGGGKNERPPPAYLTHPVAKYPWNHKNYNNPNNDQYNANNEQKQEPGNNNGMKSGSATVDSDLRKEKEDGNGRIGSGSGISGTENVLVLEFEDGEESSSKSSYRVK